MEALLPPIPHPAVRRIDTDRTRPEGYPCDGKPRLRASLFLGCIASEWFAETHRATIRVLRRNRIDVVVPDGQTCCGALHRHSGLVEEATALHEQNTAAFAGAGVDVVLVNAAGCGASLREAPAGSSTRGGPEVRDICEFLDEVGIVPPTARMERRVAYHQPCHLVHAQGVGPGSIERLLSSIPGLRLVPLRDSDRCCGSGGIYNVLHPRMAGPILEAKIEAIRESGADTVVTGNPGCLLQIRSRLRGVRILHPVELLDLAYSRSTPSGLSGDSTASE
jgi:glycolate oxidase iron-sulfur subunit